MISNDIAILIAFLSFHTFFLVLVRPYTLAVYENFSKDASLVKMKIKSIETPEESNGLKEIRLDYNAIEKFLSWEGVISFLSSDYWIFAILVGLVALIAKSKSSPTFYENWFFVFTLAYLVWTIIVFKKRYDYFVFYDKRLQKYLFLGFNILLFYIIPSSLYLFYKYKIEIIQIVNKDELSIIYIIWLLSILYFFIWHSLWALYAPFSKMKKLKEELGLADANENKK
jgi:hypothetical protein